MEKYDEIVKALDAEYAKIGERDTIPYSEKSYFMLLAIERMEKECTSADDLLMFHQALRSWMRWMSVHVMF